LRAVAGSPRAASRTHPGLRRVLLAGAGRRRCYSQRNHRWQHLRRLAVAGRYRWITMATPDLLAPFNLRVQIPPQIAPISHSRGVKKDSDRDKTPNVVTGSRAFSRFTLWHCAFGVEPSLHVGPSKSCPTASVAFALTHPVPRRNCHGPRPCADPLYRLTALRTWRHP
jgi:hypothetical protein